MFGLFSKKYVQFKNKRTGKWNKAEVKDDGRFRIVKTSDEKFPDVPVHKKKRKKRKKKR